MTSALSIDSAFVDLVCEDDELLEAEFDALVTAGWDGSVPPGAVLVRTSASRWPGFIPQLPDPGDRPPERVIAAGRGGRQRSPPRA